MPYMKYLDEESTYDVSISQGHAINDESLIHNLTFRETSDISQTKSQNSNVYRLVLQLKPSVKSRMKM